MNLGADVTGGWLALVNVILCDEGELQGSR